MKKIAISILCALMAFSAYAQQTTTMLSVARAELQKRGLTEEEVRTRLLENGIDVDDIKSSEYPAYQDRILSILNKMQAEKANLAHIYGFNQDSLYIPPAAAKDAPQTTIEEAAAEAGVQKTEEKAKVEGSDIYGHAIFTDNAMNVYRTTDGAQAPENYILGEGDEVHISIFGSSQTEIHQRIGSDGSIQPAGSTKIFLKGMTLAQGRAAIQNKLAQHYSFRQDQIAVTINTARTVTVSIYGEVAVQGGFTVSALNTAFNALAAAGGPTPIGSIRNIQLTRGGKTKRLDLYAYMADPGTAGYCDLHNGDIIYVPVAQKIVSIEGAVNRPMRYEMTDGESLINLINYAGGLSSDVYSDFVQIERFENGQKKYLEYDLSSVMKKTLKISLNGGDIVRIKAFNEPLDKYVAIEGAVYYDGNYDLSRNSSLSVLIGNAKPKVSARRDFVFVERTRADETTEVLTVPFPGSAGSSEFRLQERDLVRVLELTQYRDLDSISVSGQVREPFAKEFGLNDYMTVKQAVEYAGGLKATVFPVAYIFRRDVTNPERMEYIRVNLDSDGDTLLKPGDELRVYDNTTYTNIGEVRVSGAVNEPFRTPYDASLNIHDLLEMAGGLTVGAAYDRIEVFRMNISRTDQVTFDSIRLCVDENYNLTSGDFQLQPYDHVVVRQTPNYTTGRSVEVNGRVKYPGVYVLEDSRTQLSTIIQMAGGLLSDADPYVTLFRTYNNRGNIAVNLNEAKGGSVGGNPILMEGDVIDITRQENTVTIRETGTRMAQYVSPGNDSVQKTLVFRGRHSAKWYINHCAGGFQKAADRYSVTVTMPNNQTEGTRSFLGIPIYPTVQPGSVIALSMDQKKQEKLNEPREKVNWDSVLSRTLSTVTTMSTVFLLVERFISK